MVLVASQQKSVYIRYLYKLDNASRSQQLIWTHRNVMLSDRFLFVFSSVFSYQSLINNIIYDKNRLVCFLTRFDVGVSNKDKTNVSNSPCKFIIVVWEKSLSRETK